MFWMHACPIRGQVGRGWAIKFKSFLGPVKWHRAHRRVPFGAQKFQGPTPSHLPSLWICTHPKHYARGCINHMCINNYYLCQMLNVKCVNRRRIINTYRVKISSLYSNIFWLDNKTSSADGYYHVRGGGYPNPYKTDRILIEAYGLK
jgi:hypothetical protein